MKYISWSFGHFPLDYLNHIHDIVTMAGPIELKFPEIILEVILIYYRLFVRKCMLLFNIILQYSISDKVEGLQHWSDGDGGGGWRQVTSCHNVMVTMDAILSRLLSWLPWCHDVATLDDVTWHQPLPPMDRCWKPPSILLVCSTYLHGQTM